MKKRLLIRRKAGADNQLLFITLVLVTIGLVAVADASAPNGVRVFSDKFYFVKQQVVWAALGLILLTFFSRIRYSLWQRLATPLLFISLVALVLVFFPGMGIRTLGARRWLSIGQFSFQPSELVKLSLTLYLAKISTQKKKILSFFFPIILISFLIMLQPDLGTTLIIVGVGLAQAFIAEVNFFYFLGATFFGFLATIFLISTSGYRRDRLTTFLEQTTDPLGKSYHIRQILLALGSGGIFGIGIGASRQKYLFLPETATDSIFAVIAEEVGFLGASILILLFILFVIRGVRIVKYAPDKFSQVLAAGIVTWIGGQALLNIGSMVALVPLTGVPLPLISYGGSSLIAVLSGIGILLNISKYAKRSQ